MANHPVPSNIENSMQILGKYDQKISIPKKSFRLYLYTST